MRREPSCSGRRGFTLIELLVVLAITALMVSALLPSVSKARDQARLAACATAMKQIGVALSTYAADHLDYTPHRSPFAENDGMGGATADENMAGRTIHGFRQGPGPQRSIIEDGVPITEPINLPVGLGQLVKSVSLAPTQAATTYSDAGYLLAKDLFCPNDQVPRRMDAPARWSWWTFRDALFTPYSANWSTNAAYNGMTWPAYNAVTPATGSNYYSRGSYMYRSSDFAYMTDTNADGKMDGMQRNSTRQMLTQSHPIRSDKVVAACDKPDLHQKRAGNLLMTDGSVRSRYHPYWAANQFQVNSPVSTPDGTPVPNNPYTNEGGAHAYKMTYYFAAVDRWMKDAP